MPRALDPSVPVVVTGAAGFVGSHLVDALLAAGLRVRGLDAFTDPDARADKQRNLASALLDPRFELVEGDLLDVDLAAVLDGVGHVFHLAARPGVRTSWQDGFDPYVTTNVTGTQRLLEACLGMDVQRVVYASSSSVYGNAATYPCHEDDPTAPHSPYGVTKLAGEHLCRLYAANFGLSTVSLRYFTVYGPRQRPDMAVHRLIASALTQDPFRLYGDGSHVRDFTYVGDVVAATLAAADPAVPDGLVANVAGGSVASMSEVIDVVGDVVGARVPIKPAGLQAGDVQKTGGDTARARRHLRWAPAVSLREGVAAQVAALRGVAA